MLRAYMVRYPDGRRCSLVTDNKRPVRPPVLYTMAHYVDSGPQMYISRKEAAYLLRLVRAARKHGELSVKIVREARR